MFYPLYAAMLRNRVNMRASQFLHRDMTLSGWQNFKNKAIYCSPEIAF